MAIQGEKENPTLYIKDFQIGDPISWLMYDIQPSQGIVVNKRPDELTIRHFESGFSFDVTRNPKYGKVKKSSVDEITDHLNLISKGFQRIIDQGTLHGAVAARKQYNIDAILTEINNGRDLNSIAHTNSEAPKTGTYVLMGIYSGHGSSEHLAGLTTLPRISENSVSLLMKDLYPEGIKNIPSVVRNTHATSRGDLVAYRTYEVPKKALNLVKDPYILKIG